MKGRAFKYAERTANREGAHSMSGTVRVPTCKYVHEHDLNEGNSQPDRVHTE